MNITNIFNLFTQKEFQKIIIPKKDLEYFSKNNLIKDYYYKWNWFSFEWAVILNIYNLLKKYKFTYQEINEVWKNFKRDINSKPIFLTKDKVINWWSLSLPLISTISWKNFYVIIDKWLNVDIIDVDSLLEYISFWKEYWFNINWKLIIDLWEIISSLGNDFSIKPKWILKRLWTIMSKNEFIFEDKYWKYKFNTQYYTHPRQLDESLLKTGRSPNTTLITKSNNKWSITSIKIKSKKYID